MYMRSEVKEAFIAFMVKVVMCVGNLDIEFFILILIECINNVDEVLECVYKFVVMIFV